MNIKNDKSVTINDIARMAGVSKRTVSRVLNGSANVGERTRTNIQRIIEETNFSPNTQARGLASRKSFLIGMLYDSPTLFINDAQIGVSSVCHQMGYDLVVHPSAVASSTLLDDVERFVRRSRVDGVIVVPPLSQNNLLAKKLRDIGCNYVRFTADENCDQHESLVVTNNRKVMQDVVDHLVDAGHQRLAFVGGPLTNVASMKRFEAYRNAIESHGFMLPENYVLHGEHVYETGYQCAKQLLALPEPPTAIFAYNDEMAVGVLRAARDLGVPVPQQLSVVGFDGTWMASHYTPTLSTVARPVHEMAVLATQKLIALIDDDAPAQAAMELFVTPTFVPRESSGPCGSC